MSVIKITQKTALWRLTLALRSKGRQVGAFAKGSIASRKLGQYYLINFITNEMIDYSDYLTPWLQNEFILAPWEVIAGEEDQAVIIRGESSIRDAPVCLC